MKKRKQRGMCRWQDQFEGEGYRITEGRKAILEVLMEDPNRHWSAEDIYLRVLETHPAIGLTSIYRTLEILTNMGIVTKFDFGDGRSRYEILEGEESENHHHHHHLICTRCNLIINYNDFIDEEVELLKKTEKGLSQKYNFNIKSHIIHFHGICEKCSEG
jgi:Fur family transcriptional regulator, ferric uptake regulator